MARRGAVLLVCAPPGRGKRIRRRIPWKSSERRARDAIEDIRAALAATLWPRVLFDDRIRLARLALLLQVRAPHVSAGDLAALPWPLLAAGFGPPGMLEMELKVGAASTAEFFFDNSKVNVSCPTSRQKPQPQEPKPQGPQPQALAAT